MRASNQNEKYVVGVPPATRTATTAISGNSVTTAVSGGATNGGIDTRGFRRLVAVACVGAIVTGGGLNMKLQESNDEAAADAYADITGASITALTDASDNSCPSIELPLEGRSRYIRAVLSPTTADSCAAGVLFILKEPIVEPTTQLTTPVVVSPTVAVA